MQTTTYWIPLNYDDESLWKHSYVIGYDSERNESYIGWFNDVPKPHFHGMTQWGDREVSITHWHPLPIISE